MTEHIARTLYDYHDLIAAGCIVGYAMWLLYRDVKEDAEMWDTPPTERGLGTGWLSQHGPVGPPTPCIKRG